MSNCSAEYQALQDATEEYTSAYNAWIECVSQTGGDCEEEFATLQSATEKYTAAYSVWIECIASQQSVSARLIFQLGMQLGAMKRANRSRKVNDVHVSGFCFGSLQMGAVMIRESDRGNE